MKGGELGVRAACWSALDDCGDCFEGVLEALPPVDVAACRLVSRAWRRHVDLVLRRLHPAAGASPAALAARWRHLMRLRLAAGPRGGLPPLDALPALRCLRSLALHGPAGGAADLDCRRLAPLAALPALEALEVCDLRLGHAPALAALTRLAALDMRGCCLGGWQGGLPALLLPLCRLSRLAFREARRPGAALPPSLAGLSRLTSLAALELCCQDGASDAVCEEAACLPRLASLSIARCPGYGEAAPSVGAAGLAALAAAAAARLTALRLTGLCGVADAGVAAVARMAALQRLELRFGEPAARRGDAAAQPTDGALAALAALTALRSLHLGGACGLAERACAALAARLRGLTALQLTAARGLDDRAAYRLVPLSPGLLRLGLNNCEGVTDIALAALLRPATALTRLELAGCHRHVTGTGLPLAGLKRLRRLNLAGCDAITDAEIRALLPAAASLEHLSLADCRMGDAACALLAASAPALRWLSLEHCPEVGAPGLQHLAEGLPLLEEVHLAGSGVPPEAVAALLASPRGRRLRVATRKHCWWLPQADGDGGDARA